MDKLDTIYYCFPDFVIRVHFLIAIKWFLRSSKNTIGRRVSFCVKAKFCLFSTNLYELNS
jgi:hypothetical protein